MYQQREENLIPALTADGRTSPPVRSVKQVNALVQQTLAKYLPAEFMVRGEISNFRTYDRGHAFFTLKEPGAELPCIMWRDALSRLKFRPKDGLAVIARGSVKMYEPQGRVQLYVEDILPQGTGGLELAFRQLCEKLKAEGLFEPQRKRPLPLLPRRIVIITSRTGDVLHDVLTTAYRRYPGLHAMLYPVPVQGETAAPKIVEALARINRHAEALGGVDLILLVRGGGSLEDLWAFNEEIVARAIVASQIPIATGIGHEPDTTIADLVGDLRGPTPTGVTELTIPDVESLRQEIDALGNVLRREVANTVSRSGGDVQRMVLELAQAVRGRIRLACVRVDNFATQVGRIEPRHAIAQGWRRVEEKQRELKEQTNLRLMRAEERLNQLHRRLEKANPEGRIIRWRDRVAHLDACLPLAMRRLTQNRSEKLLNIQQRLQAISPLAVLQRGYSLTMNAQGQVVHSKSQVKNGDILTTRVADGEIKSTVGQPRQSSLF